MVPTMASSITQERDTLRYDVAGPVTQPEGAFEQIDHLGSIHKCEVCDPERAFAIAHPAATHFTMSHLANSAGTSTILSTGTTPQACR